MSVKICVSVMWRASLHNHVVFIFNQSPTLHLHLSDIDECKTGQLCGPSSHCHNTNGSFYCTCQRDYIPTSGAKHFHPESGVRCKGRYEDGRVHTPCTGKHNTHVHWYLHPGTCIFLFFKKTSLTYTQISSILNVFLFFFGDSIMQHITVNGAIIVVVFWMF